MRIACLIAQYLLGLGFVVFGLNGFLHFIPQPPPPSEQAVAFFRAMAGTHFLAPVFAVQLLGGLLLLANRFVPLALVALAGVLFNVLVYHAVMDPKGLPPGVVFTALWAAAAYRVWPAFGGLLRARPATV